MNENSVNELRTKAVVAATSSHADYCCAGCSANPSQDELRRNHGTPYEFRVAVINAMADGVTAEEALRAVVGYENEWCSAQRRSL